MGFCLPRFALFLHAFEFLHYLEELRVDRRLVACQLIYNFKIIAGATKAEVVLALDKAALAHELDGEFLYQHALNCAHGLIVVK